MLKGLLRELGKGLRRGGVAEAGATAQSDPLAEWKTAFRSGNAAQRFALVDRLDAWIAERPGKKQGWTLRGDWLLQLGDLVKAEDSYRRALQIDPMSPATQEGLGLLLLQTRRIEEAYLHLELAHKLQPMNSEVLVHWGLVALEMGNLDDAHKKFERAVERDVQNPHAWHNLGLVATKRGQSKKGIEFLGRAIELMPDHGLAHSNIALAYRDAERLDQAVAAARRATELKPQSARVWVVLGDVLIDAGEFAEAEQALQRAVALDAKLPSPLVALGKLYTAWGRHETAEQAYVAALRLAPQSAEATGGLGQVELLRGRFDVGWNHYEARKQTDAAPVRSFPFLEWQGESLAGRTVLVHAEQGLGDIILFLSCVPDLQAQGARVILETDPRLAALLTRSFPDAIVVGHDSRDGGLDWLRGLPDVERHISIGSLPKYLRTAIECFPAHNGYLRPDPVRVAHWRERLAALGDRPVVGLAWRGGLARSGGTQRSLDLHELLRPLQGTGALFVSLQYGDVRAEVEDANHLLASGMQHWPEALADQDEVAALTSALDAVISVCSTQAHLTGALGLPGCVLVPANPNWRYGAAGAATPWYPSLTLVRQSRLGDWSDALTAARHWLDNRLRLQQSKRNSA